MKKLCAALLAVVLVMSASVYAVAGTFDNYWDFEQADETYAYAFSRIMVSMDKNWYQNTRVVLGDDGSTASFYHKGSYNAYAAEGLTGGLLFTIGACADTDFQSLPQFTYLGFDEEEAIHYYAALPTDYPAYAGDEAIRAEYDALWSGVEDVIAGIQIKGGAEYEEFHKTEADLPEIFSCADYDYLIHDDTSAITIVKYTGDENVIAIPSEIDGYQVTAIGPEAFSYGKFERVSIPDSIPRVGEQAFAYCQITEALTLPKNTVIAEGAFSYATLPSLVVIPEGSTVEKCAFSYCHGMEQAVIEPGAVIKSRAFGYCRNLGWAICAEGSQLEEKAFEYCKVMKGATLCGNVSIADSAFSNCAELEVAQEAASEYPALKQSALNGRRDSDPPQAEEINLQVPGSPAALDGVTIALEKATAVRDPKTGDFTYTFTGTLENNSDEYIMKVIYTFALIDESGEEFRSFSMVFDGKDAAIAPHAKITFAHDGIKWGRQSIPAAVEMEIASVKTEAELPPVHVPKAGEYLYQALGDENLAGIKEEPPVALSFHVDRGGYGRTAVFKEGSALNKAVELLCGIQIGAESGEWVTDNYNWIELTWKDGSRTSINLNLYNLEHSIHSTPHTYKLENLDAFWSYCADYLKEDA